MKEVIVVGGGLAGSDAAYYLVSRLVSHLAGERTSDYLNRKLFQPLKVREVAWSCCPHNYPIGATGLYLSAYDMVKLPALYLEGGMWDGKRVLSQAWINKVIVIRPGMATIPVPSTMVAGFSSGAVFPM